MDNKVTVKNPGELMNQLMTRLGVTATDAMFGALEISRANGGFPLTIEFGGIQMEGDQSDTSTETQDHHGTSRKKGQDDYLDALSYSVEMADQFLSYEETETFSRLAKKILEAKHMSGDSPEGKLFQGLDSALKLVDGIFKSSEEVAMRSSALDAMNVLLQVRSDLKKYIEGSNHQ